MNDENLIPNSARTPSETREMGRAGGIASGRSRRIKSRGRQLVLDLLAGRETDPKVVASLEAEGINAKDLTREVAMHLRQIDKAIKKADSYAYNSVLKAAGILTDEVNIGARDGAVQVIVGSPEAAKGLQRAMETGAQPRDPDKED